MVVSMSLIACGGTHTNVIIPVGLSPNETLLASILVRWWWMRSDRKWLPGLSHRFVLARKRTRTE
jgi:hypothetical protein